MSIDRRQFKRFETLLIVEIGPQKESASYFFGITKNVSFEGFIFESQNYDLRSGDILEFRLKHPQSKLSVPVLGEIVWNRETKFECYSGVKFHRFDNETKSKVFELISADSIEHSGHVTPGEEVRSNQTGQGDTHNGAPLPANVGNHKDDMSDESAGGEDPGDTVKIGGQAPEVEKVEGKLVQENVSRATNGSIAARRKEHKKRSPYSLIASVFVALFIASALIMFMSDDIREKIIPPELSSRFIKNNDAANHDGGMPVLKEKGAYETPPTPIDQSESLPDYDKQTASEQALTETGKPLDQNGYEELADHDYDGTAEQLTTLQMTDEMVVAQDKTVLLKEAERESYPTVVSPQDHSARANDEGSPDHIALMDSGDKNINKVKVEVSVRKKEAVQKIVQKIRATLKEESKPVSKSAKGKRAEKSVAPEEKKNLQQAPVQERSKTASSKKNDKAKKISTSEKDEAVVLKEVTAVSSNKKKETKALSSAVREKPDVQKSIAFQQPDGVSGDTPKNLKSVPTQDKEKGKEIQIAKNLSGNKEKKRVQAVKSVKKLKTGVGSEPKIQDVSNVSKQEQSKKPADRDRRPRIALVLKNNQSKVADVNNKQPEITDEYLSKYYTVYTDFFNDNSNNWDIFDIGAASARIEDGLYHIENKKEGGALIVLHYLPFPHSSDFVLEIAIMSIKGGADNSYGFIFGAKDARDNYSFQIREGKYYSVKNYHHGVPGYLTTGKIKGLVTDKKSAALLKIVKQADDIKFYINNGYVDKVTNLDFYGNQIGFIVEGKSHIAIDYTRSYIRKSDHEHTN